MPAVAIPGLPRSQTATRPVSGDQAGSPLEHRNRIVAARELANGTESVALDGVGRRREESSGLGWMRRQQPAPARHRCFGEKIQAVGIDDERQLRAEELP